MEDYELERARAWDDSLPNAPGGDAAFEWQEVTHAKKNKKSKEPLQTTSLHRDQHQPAARNPATASAPAPAPALAVSAPAPHPTRWPQRAATRATPGWRQHAAPSAPAADGPPPRLIDLADNEAMLAWRARQPPKVTVRIPSAMVTAEKHGNSLPTYMKLAQNLSTYVHSDEFSRGNNVLEFGIWGDRANEAKKAILNWIDIAEPSAKSAGSAKFPKVVSLTPVLRKKADDQWARDLRKNAYRQNPPSNMPFECIGSFHWPTDEFRPEETFGMAYEALDGIRMEQRCYIIFDRAQSTFRVHGKISDVEKALVRIRKTYYHLSARQMSPVRAYLLQWRASDDVPTHVYLEDYWAAGAETSKKVPRGEGAIGDEKQLEAARMSSKYNLQWARETISNALRNAHYLRAQLQLRVRLGVFYLQSYKPPGDGDADDMYELDEYEEMTKQSQFAGTTSEEMGGRDIEGRALALVRSWDDILSPLIAMTETLPEVRPSYGAEFVFDDDKGELHLACLWHEADLDESGTMQFTGPDKKWTRPHRDTSNTKLLDLNLTDLNSGTAWAFELTSVAPEEPKRLSQAHRSFGERVKINASIATEPLIKSRFVQFNPFARPKSLRQTIRYQYMIQGSDCCLELAQYQDRTFTPEDYETGIVQEPRWSLNAFRVEWDTNFDKNAQLKVGTMAEWDDDMADWFPKHWDSRNDDDGFINLMEKLHKIEKRFRDGAAEQEDMI